MTGKSGADLEYERMLREAGIAQASAQGYDAARLEQLRDANGWVVPDVELPARLRATPLVVTDANLAVENGFYRLTDTSANTPYASFWLVLVQSDVPGLFYITQTAHEYGLDGSIDTKTYRREKNNGTWGSWYRLRSSESELDSRYLNQGQAVTNSELPNRLWDDSTNVVPADLNTARSNGWFRVIATCTNKPPGIDYGMGFTFTYDNNECVQRVYQANTPAGAPNVAERVRLNSGTWTAWYNVYGPRLSAGTEFQQYTDANLYVDSGWYWIAGDSVNVPAPNKWGWLRVVRHASNGFVHQEWIAWENGFNGERWERRKDTVGWNLWQRMYVNRIELDNRYNAGPLYSKIQNYQALVSGATTGLEATVGPYTKDGTTYDQVLARYATGGSGSILRAYGVDRNGMWTRAFWYKRRGATDVTFDVDVADSPMSAGTTFIATSTWQRAVVRIEISNFANNIRFSDINFTMASDIYIFEDSLTFGGQPAQPDSTWINVGSGLGAPAFQNSWVNFGGTEANAAFRKIGNRVTLQGTIKTGALGTISFTLPVGYRPISSPQFSVVSNGGAGTCQIGADGNFVPLTGSNVRFNLDGISFLVD